MARPFAITSDDRVILKPRPQGEPQDRLRGAASITITNASASPERVRLRLKATPPTQQEWLIAPEEAEWDLPAEGTRQVSVRVEVPAGTPAGQYPFLPVVEAERLPEEVFTEGKQITIEVQPTEQPARQFPVWVFPVAAAVLLVVGVGLWLALRSRAVSVPDVVGKPMAEAKRLVEAKGLVVEEGPLTLAGPGVPGTCATQEPPKETPLKPKAKVKLSEEGVSVPSLGGQTVDAAKQALETAQLEPGTTNYIWQSDQILAPVGTVLTSVPPAGSALRIATPVDLVVVWRNFRHPSGGRLLELGELTASGVNLEELADQGP
jgi:hypothetical protein